LVQRQVMVSWTPCCRCTSCIGIQRDTNSSMWVAEVIFLPCLCIQLLFRSSFCTIWFVLETSRNKFRARYLGACPSSQLWCQNFVFAPSPKDIMIEELKRRRSSSEHGSFKPLQGLESSTHSYQSHRNRRARLNLSRSGTPKPPRSFGLVTVCQLTRQCPPFAFSSPFHKKDLLILSIFFLAHAAKGNTVRW